MSDDSTQSEPLADAIVRALRADGVDRVFGIPSGYFSSLLAALARQSVPSVEGRHEGSTAMMAAAYAQATGQPAVLYTASGPGTTNALTGLAAAYANFVPMVVLASQPSQSHYGRYAHQESAGATRSVDQLEACRTVSHFRARPPTAEGALRMVRVALANARAHRGPALVDLAANLLREEVPSAEVAPSAYRLIDPAPVDLEAVRRAAQLVRDARRPALLVGDQLMHRSAHGPLTSLLESQRLPCATVDYAKGVIPEDHPWLLGLLGECGHGSVTEYLSEADLVLAFGVRLTEVTTFGWDETLFPNLIQVDSVAGEIGRALPIRDGILGDPLATVRALAEELGPVTEARQELQDVVSALRYKHGVYAPPAAKQNQLSTPILAHTLRTTTPRETVLVTDTGMTAQYMKRHFPVFAPDGSFSLYALAPMGMGLPLALGAQLARPSAPVLNVIGDGGLLVHAGDLNVAAQHGLPVITVVVNNGGYKQIRDRLEHWFGCDYATTISGVDYAALARAFGCDGYSATNPVELADAVQQAVDSKRPAVIDAKVYGDSLLDLMPESVIEWANATFGTAGA